MRTARVANQARALGMKRLGVYVHPSGWDASLSQSDKRIWATNRIPWLFEN